MLRNTKKRQIIETTRFLSNRFAEWISVKFSVKRKNWLAKFFLIHTYFFTYVSKILNIIIISFYSSTFIFTSPVSASIALFPFLFEATCPSTFLSYSCPQRLKYEGLKRIESLHKCILRTSYHYSWKSKPLLVIRNSNWEVGLLFPKAKFKKYLKEENDLIIWRQFSCPNVSYILYNLSNLSGEAS